MRESANARNCGVGVLNVTGTKSDQPADHSMSHKRVDVSKNAEIIEFGRLLVERACSCATGCVMNRSPST
jgi:hypothetical protein